MYISIGHKCNVKYQIDKHSKKKETLFFDWLMTDMNSVNTILDPSTNINNILNLDNLTIKPYYNNSEIIIKSLSKCVSIHDVKKNPTIDNINTDFIVKYKRRYHRLINYIKSTKKIYFCRYGPIEINEKNNFIQIIKNINHNCNFALINIIEKEENTNFVIEKEENTNFVIEEEENTNFVIEEEENFLKIVAYYKNKNTNSKVPIWRTSYLDWKKIFTAIENNI